jgi:UDP-N-acetylglucosamine diphosphorylase / glucose-1-phosphate thymidylyltransferase / UDP-N-acetylgalactosamine diphosphorylase / glucosamine-1-phosphate N-acetyltransferase / galactosamine-1-phosphate N-acetyltransferase
MIRIQDYIDLFVKYFPGLEALQPWEITGSLTTLLETISKGNMADYKSEGSILVHKSAIIEKSTILKGPIIISEGCFVGSGAYLRGGVYLGKNVSVGPGCEIKSSILFPETHIAHFNFIGDSIIGTDVNFEAGAVIANHYNERTDKDIYVLDNSVKINTGVQKFGAIVGDFSRIGANSVLSPGTILEKNSIVKRLELVEQIRVS